MVAPLITALHQTEEFASLPTVASKLLKFLERDDVDMRSIAHHIEQDVAIATKVIRVANSPAFGLRSPVHSILHAIMTIGLNRVSNIVLSVSIFSKFVYLNTLAGSYLSRFWMHSAVTATLSRELNRLCNIQLDEMEFLAGLVHDIGKLTMLQHDAEKFKQLSKLIEQGANELEAETLLFGATHAEIGEVIANLWKLPPFIQGAIRHHHNEASGSSEIAPLVSIIRVADILSEEMGYGIQEPNLSPLEEHESWKYYCQLAHIMPTEVNEFRKSMYSIVEKASSFLSALSNG